MNYYFKLREPSDDDSIETDDYLEHANSKNPDNQLYVFDRVWKDSEGHWRVDLKNTVTGATATRIGIDPKYEGKPLSFNAVKSTVRYALDNHKIAIKDSEVDKIVYTFMRLAPQFFTETGRSNYTINRGGSKNPKKSTSTLPPQYLKHSNESIVLPLQSDVTSPRASFENNQNIVLLYRINNKTNHRVVIRAVGTTSGRFGSGIPKFDPKSYSYDMIRKSIKYSIDTNPSAHTIDESGLDLMTKNSINQINSLLASRRNNQYSGLRHSVSIDSVMCAVVPSSEKLIPEESD